MVEERMAKQKKVAEQAAGQETVVELEARRIERVMSRAYELKNMLDPKREGSPAFEYGQAKLELATVIAEGKVQVHEVPGKPTKFIALGGYKFSSRLQEGRKTLDKDKLTQELLARGLVIGVIMDILSAAEKQGVPFFVNEITLDD